MRERGFLGNAIDEKTDMCYYIYVDGRSEFAPSARGAMEEKNYSANNIEAVLDLGRIYSGASAVMLYVFAGLCLVAPIISAALGIAAGVGAVSWNENLTVASSVLSVASALILAYTITVIIGNVRNKRAVDEWLTDSVAVSALVRRIPPESDEFVRNRISVSFELNGEKKFIMSMPKAWAKDINKRFLRYDGHNVPIMYNAEHNKVMLVFVDPGDTRK